MRCVGRRGERSHTLCCVRFRAARLNAGGAVMGMLCARLISRRLSGTPTRRGIAVFAGVIAITLMVKATISIRNLKIPMVRQGPAERGRNK